MRNALRLARIAAGLSQAAAGRLIGKTQSHYGKIELGKVNLTVSEAITLAEYFGLKIEDLR